FRRAGKSSHPARPGYSRAKAPEQSRSRKPFLSLYIGSQKMSSDVEPIGGAKHSLTDTVCGALGAINFKMVLALAIFFLVLTSNMFVETVLSRFSGAVQEGVPTAKGAVIQGIILALFYILWDAVINWDLI